ncbi:MAG: DMT family transporter [Acidobacteriota bacterium]
MNHRMLPLIYLVILGAIWGLHFSVNKIAAQSGLSYRGIAAITTTGVATALVFIAIIRRRWPAYNLTHLRFYFICAILGYVAPFFLELFSAAHLPASVLTLVVSSSPLFTVVLALAVGSDTITPRRSLGIAIGAGSASLILVPAVLGLSDVPVAWIALAFSVPLTYASYHNYVAKAWPRESDSFQVACGEALAALLILLPIYLWRGNVGEMQGALGLGHLAIGVMVVFAVIEIFLYFEIVRLAGPIFVSQANYVTVVIGVFFGMIIFGEPLSRWIILSAGLLGLALYLMAMQRSKSENPENGVPDARESP